MSATEKLGPDFDGLLEGLTGIPEEELEVARPEIQCNDRNLDEVTSEALEAIGVANRPPVLFQRGGALVRLRVDKATGAPSLETLGADAVRGHLARVASWHTTRATGAGPVRTLVSPPMDVVKDLLALPGWFVSGIPPLIGIIERPAFAAAGTLVATPGYDPSAQLLYQPTPGLHVPEVPDAPSKAQIGRAKEWLLQDLMEDFPFKDEASRTNALALLLLPFVRELIDGPTPLHLIDAARPGTGKGLLVDAIHIVATGRCAAVTAEVGEDGEWRKRILAALLDGPEFVVIDNITGYVDSGALAATLTARTVRDRILGISKMAEVPVRCVWVGTGNNVRMSQELARRTPLIRLVAASERPWERPASDFRHPDLRQWATENRGQLIAAALTLCRAWIAAGMPGGEATVGSYEAWSWKLGGLMKVIERPDFMGNADEMMKHANDDEPKWGAFVRQWWDSHHDRTVGVKELFVLVKAHELLEAVLGDRDEDQSKKIKLGLKLRKRLDSWYGDLRIAPGGEARNGSPLYRLEIRPGVASPRIPGG